MSCLCLYDTDVHRAILNTGNRCLSMTYDNHDTHDSFIVVIYNSTVDFNFQLQFFYVVILKHRILKMKIKQ